MQGSRKLVRHMYNDFFPDEYNIVLVSVAYYFLLVLSLKISLNFLCCEWLFSSSQGALEGSYGTSSHGTVLVHDRSYGQVQALPYFISGIGTFHNWQCLARLVSSSNSISSYPRVSDTAYNLSCRKNQVCKINPFPLSI